MTATRRIRARILAALGVLALQAGIAEAIPLGTPTHTMTVAAPEASPTATPTNTAALVDTATYTPVPASPTATATQTTAPTASASPTQSPVATATISFAATSVKSGKSNTSDRLGVAPALSASTALSGPSDTRTVYQTPARGDFVLTQICVSPTAAGGILVSAAGLGPIAQLGGSVRSCQSFDPGFIAPPNAAITCSTSASAAPGDYFCMIAGLQNR
jgi:hypothetical protein